MTMKNQRNDIAFEIVTEVIAQAQADAIMDPVNAAFLAISNVLLALAERPVICINRM